MTIKVVNRDDPEIFTIYKNIEKVVDVFNDNGNFCHQLQWTDGVDLGTATYPATEWYFYQLNWVKMF